METNKFELHQVYKEIQTDLDSWDQTKWAVNWPEYLKNSWVVTDPIERMNQSCGTAYCFAGHTVLRAGHQFHWVRGGAVEVVIDGEYRQIRHVAQAILGLTDVQAGYLFDPTNKLEDIRSRITLITGEDPDA